MALLVAYRSERLPAAPVTAASLLLAAAVQPRWPHDPVAFFVDSLLAFTLFAQFRVWDDIADRHRDGTYNPDRVLVRATSTAPFMLLCAALMIVTILVVAARGGDRAAYLVFGGTNAGMAIWYATRGPRSVAGDHLLLAKYPAFACIIAASRGDVRIGLLLPMAAVYLAACLYEAAHDSRSPTIERPALLAAEAMLFAVALLGMSMRGES